MLRAFCFPPFSRATNRFSGADCMRDWISWGRLSVDHKGPYIIGGAYLSAELLTFRIWILLSCLKWRELKFVPRPGFLKSWVGFRKMRVIDWSRWLCSPVQGGVQLCVLLCHHLHSDRHHHSVQHGAEIWGNHFHGVRVAHRRDVQHFCGPLHGRDLLRLSHFRRSLLLELQARRAVVGALCSMDDWLVSELDAQRSTTILVPTCLATSALLS